MRQNDHHKYKKFRERFPYFRYVNYAYEKKDGDLYLSFTFDISGKYTFTPSLKLVHRSFYHLEDLSGDDLNNLVFHIGMIELISYWKLTCSPQVIIEPHQLTTDQVDWWKKLYFNGLGEFFYLNGISPDENNFMQIESKGTMPVKVSRKLSEEKVLVPVGGGKDSVVTLELLKNTSFDIYPVMLNPRDASIRTVEVAGYDMEQSVVVQRKLDPLMLELNAQGFLNGHTPFSALLAFVNALAAVATGAKYVALSNENSANESTVPGTNINHQYSKSFEFEQDFANYCRKYIHPKLAYFSFLRPLNELQIAELFSRYPQHFDSFRSCNVGSKNDTWCGKCPKCLFTRIILAPFVTEEKLQEIFHGELLEDTTLKNTFDELTGTLPVKPFECVGTPDEINTAIDAVYGGTEQNNLPALLKNYKFPVRGKKHFDELMQSFNFFHLLPAPFLKVLIKHLNIPVSERFGIFLKSKFGHDPKILILGFGKEGQSGYRLLREIYPDVQLHIADRNELLREMEVFEKDKQVVFYTGPDYQSVLEDFSVIIKSPGVKIEKPSDGLILRSQTDLFLEYFGEQTIGITGTKGKSTTSSLIHHVLKESGKNALLLGNIGIPPFDMVAQIDDDTLIVFEMSAHQLEHVKHAPRVAVLLNIFPEHLDHFKNINAYRKAKNNILNYQKPTDIAIIHQQFATETKGKSLLFGPEKQKGLAAWVDGNKLVFPGSGALFTVSADRKALIGKHNLLNILAAILAVNQYGIKEKEAFEHVSSFRLLPHRLEFTGSYRGIDFYNDSISTVPESTLAAVEALGQVKTLILGGYDRGLDYRQMVQTLDESNVEYFLFMGKAGEVMRRIFQEIHSEKSLVKVETIDEAVAYALQKSISGICLLSPAAASYDQFHNFEHRGDAYKKAIEELAHKKSG